ARYLLIKCQMDRTRKGMAKYPGLPLSNHKPDNSFAMKTGHLEMLLTIIKSTIDPWKIKCYMLQHVTTT
ncbi:MAG: hypothetical protein KKD50_05730, partial [Proteobacteria bacterium]|nr:hypothetical protein [Pseudomonadota bacterium]